MKLKDILTMIGVWFFSYSLFQLYFYVTYIYFDFDFYTCFGIVIVVGVILIALNAVVVYLKKIWIKIEKGE